MARAILDRYRAVDPPWYVLAMVAFAVFVMPGGIPLTTVLTPIYIRHRLQSRAVAALPAIP